MILDDSSRFLLVTRGSPASRDDDGEVAATGAGCCSVGAEPFALSLLLLSPRLKTDAIRRMAGWLASQARLWTLGTGKRGVRKVRKED